MTSRKTYFIADVHLSMGPDPKKKLILSFLDRLIEQRADLYILGDFFDFWANNKDVFRFHSEVLSKLSTLTSGGSKVVFLIGNRDFLLSEKKAAAILVHQISAISKNWNTVCEEAGLSGTDRALLWGRQYLNPFAFDDLTGGFTKIKKLASEIRFQGVKS